MQTSSKLTLKAENGKKESYNVLFEVESEKFNYIVYTKNKIDKNGDTVVYFAKYIKDEMNLKNVGKKEEEQLKIILNKFRSKNGK